MTRHSYQTFLMLLHSENVITQDLDFGLVLLDNIGLVAFAQSFHLFD